MKTYLERRCWPLRMKTMALCFSFCACSVLAMVGTPAYGKEAIKERSRIAVVNFAANNTDAGISRGVRNSVEMNLFRDGSFDILEQSQMDIVLKERKLQLMECSDEKCAAKLGKLLKADYVIIGSVDKLGDFTVNVKVVDVKEGKIVISESKDAREIGGLKPASEDVTRKVASRIKGRTQAKGTFPYPVFMNANFLFAMPVGYLKEVSDRGYGASLSVRIENLLVTGFFCGLEAQFMYFDGTGKMHHAMMIPFAADIGYAYTIWKVSIVPAIGVGGNYAMNYYYTDQIKYWKVRRNGFQAYLKAGASFDFLVYKNFYLRIGADYNIFFEKGGNIGYFTCMAGMGLKF